MTTPHRFQRSSPYTGRALVAVFYINLFSLPPRGRGTARAVVGVPPYTRKPISLSFISTPWRNARKGFFLVNLAIFAIRHTHARVERAFFSIFNTKFTPFYYTQSSPFMDFLYRQTPLRHEKKPSKRMAFHNYTMYIRIYLMFLYIGP